MSLRLTSGPAARRRHVVGVRRVDVDPRLDLAPDVDRSRLPPCVIEVA